MVKGWDGVMGVSRFKSQSGKKNLPIKKIYLSKKKSLSLAGFFSLIILGFRNSDLFFL